MNKKTLITIVASIILAGCTPSTKPADFPARPDHLKDCTFDQLIGEHGTYIIVVRCPHSDTSATYNVGKHKKTTATILE